MQAYDTHALELIAGALARTYDLDSRLRIGPYLLRKEHLAALGLSARGAPEQVFVVEHKHRGDELGLYLADDVLAALAPAHGAASVAQLVGCVPLPALMYATEGVSHMLWLEQRRRVGDCTRLIELELQAELDKFVIVLLGCEGKAGMSPTATRALLRELFVLPELAATLHSEEQSRYRAASRAAELFLRERALVTTSRVQSHALLPLLRRYCRQSLGDKLM